MRTFIIALSLFTLIGCASKTSLKQTIASQDEVKNEATNSIADLPLSKRVYILQHRVLTDWTYNSDSLFFDDLMEGNLENLRSVAKEYVSTEYASEIALEAFPKENAVVIIFPKPKSLANCFFILIKKSGQKFDYFTFERTLTFGDEDITGVIGYWDGEGNHGNLGPRPYKTHSEFAAELLRLN